MARRLAVVLALGVGLGLGLMGCDVTIDAADYDRTCVVDSDCVSVFSGDVCAARNGCGCTNSTIAAADLATYRTDVAAVTCFPADPLSSVDCLCAVNAPVCTDGTCTD